MKKFFSFFLKDFVEYLISCMAGVLFVVYCFVIINYFPRSYMLIITITAIFIGVVYIFRPNVFKRKSKK